MLLKLPVECIAAVPGKTSASAPTTSVWKLPALCKDDTNDVLSYDPIYSPTHLADLLLPPSQPPTRAETSFKVLVGLTWQLPACAGGRCYQTVEVVALKMDPEQQASYQTLYKSIQSAVQYALEAGEDGVMQNYASVRTWPVGR